MKGDTAVVIANGLKQAETILDIIRGKPVGTLVTKNGHDELVTPVDTMADQGIQCCVHCACMHALHTYIHTYMHACIIHTCMHA